MNEKRTGRPVIYIPIESKKREFDGKVLLSAALLARGFRVAIGTKSGIHRELLYARDGVYLAKSASNEHLTLYRQLQERGHKLAVLDVEGGALTKEIKSDLLRSYQPESAGCFDYFYVFGEKIKEAIVHHLPYIQEKQVVVTGEPRFDFLRPDYEAFYAGMVQQIRQRYGRFLLINTSFGLANSLLGEEGIRRFLETTVDIPDEQRGLYLLKHEEGKYLLKAFVAMAQELAVRYPDVNVVLRPHPDEDPAVYHDAVSGHPNLFVDGNWSVHPWLMAARAVVHHDCTTGLEAVMAGKPVVSYIPRMEESITAWLPVYMSMACRETREVIDAVAPFVHNEDESRWCPDKEKQKVFSGYFNNYHQPAGELLADALLKAYGHLNTTTPASLQLLWQRTRSSLSIKRYRNRQSPGSRHRFLWIDKEEVKQKLAKTGQIPDGITIEYKLPGSNVLLMELQE